MSRKSRKFTLVELLTVICIIGVLIGIVMSLMSYAMRKSADARTKAIIQQISVALESYKAKYGYYIQQVVANGFYLDKVDPGATATSHPEQMVTNNFCQFIDFSSMTNRNCQKYPSDATTIANSTFMVLDGYGYPLVYRCPGYFNRNGFDLGSVGADGKWGNCTSTSTSPSPSVTTSTNIGSVSASFYTNSTTPTSTTTIPACYFGLGDDLTNFNR